MLRSGGREVGDQGRCLGDLVGWVRRLRGCRRQDTPGPGAIAIWSRQGSTVGLAIMRYEQGVVVDVPVPEPLVERA